MVYVISKNGKPLMPCENVIARLLLKDCKAKVKKKCPFTIQLKYDSTEYTQEVVLGQDTGSKHIGTACVANGEVLYQSQVELRTDIKSKMDSRRQARRFRRSRKTRYRKPRFLNRANSTKKGRLPPSVRHKVQAHIDEIEFCKKILPVSKVILEVSQFDTHLMKNPALINEKIKHWGYQKGFDYGFSSRKEAVRHRDNYTCQCCGKKHTRLEVHHIIYQSIGGTNDEDNLITLCKDCHNKIHNGILILDKKPKKMNLKHATHMSIIRSQLLKAYPEAIETFGFVTKENRNHLSLPKGHFIDACVIASGGNSFKTNAEIYYKKRVAKQNRQMCKGVRGEKKIPLGKLFGFRKFDKVKYLGQECFIKARRSSGAFVLMDIFGKSLDFRTIGGKANPSYKELHRTTVRTSTITEMKAMRNTKMTVYETKQNLFHEYVTERNKKIFGNTFFQPDGESYETASFYINNAKWLNIFDTEKNIVGFIILEKNTPLNSAFFPDNISANYYLTHAYVLPEYRNKKLFKHTLLNYLNEHKGIYAIHLLKNDDDVSTIIDRVFLNDMSNNEFIGYSDPTDMYEDVEYVVLYKVN